MSKKIIFITSFNTSPFLPVSRTKEWNDYRFKLWLRFTYPSICNQSYSDIEYWLFCQDELKDITEAYKVSIKDPRVKIIYLSELKSTIRSLKPADWFILPRVDSDDLYHRDVAKTLIDQAIPVGKAYYQFTHGYALNINTKELKYWAQAESPFYAFIYGPDFPTINQFWLVDHTKVHPQAEKITQRAFLVLVHGKNTSTTLEKIYAGSPVTDPKNKQELLKDFLSPDEIKNVC